MRTKLHLFPSVSLEQVNEYKDIIEKHAELFAYSQYGKKNENRNRDRIFENVKKGSRIKVAACLSNGRDPIQEIDWVCVGSYNEGYAYFGNKESYVIGVCLENIDNDEITISFSKDKYKKNVLKPIEKHNYSKFTEFVFFEKEIDTYFHLGRLLSENMKKPVDSTQWNEIFKFALTFEKQDGLIVLS